MENNRPFLEVLWAAQRSGLHYTAINRHLRTGEVQYVLDDCGATALVVVRGDGRGGRRLDLSRHRDTVCAVGELDGFERYDDVLGDRGSDRRSTTSKRAGRCCTPPGTTGRPKGVRKALPGTPFGDPSVGAGADRAGHRHVRRRARMRSTSRPRRSTTPHRSCTRCRCTGSAPPSS